ncbi:32268_t:CDS:2, partial [Racocetra persica]
RASLEFDMKTQMQNDNTDDSDGEEVTSTLWKWKWSEIWINSLLTWTSNIKRMKKVAN